MPRRTGISFSAMPPLFLFRADGGKNGVSALCHGREAFADAEGEGGRTESPAAAGFSMQKVVTTVRKEVNERIGNVSDMLSGKVIAATETVAGKIDDIAREVTGECDRPSPPSSSSSSSSSRDRYYMPPDRLTFLNRLRKTDPQTYTRVVEFAQKYCSDEYGGDRNVDGPEFLRTQFAVSS